MDEHKPQEREVKCPYFRRFGDRKIVCEGHHDGCYSLATNFVNNKVMIRQLEVYCNDNYTKCEIYRLVSKAKYDIEVE